MGRRPDGGGEGTASPGRELRTVLLELAEEPGLSIPLAPWAELVAADGYHVLLSVRAASVERVRLAAGAVEAAVEDVRSLARSRGIAHVTWWLGELSTPRGLAERLEGLGFEPDPDLPAMTSLALSSPPAGEAGVEVRRIETADDYLRALELDWDVWETPEEERAQWRDRQREAWPTLAANGRAVHYLAYLDGEPAGFARGIFTPAAVVLMGGSTRPETRGRGVYTSLVHARWRDAVARGTPRMAVSAGPMSAPILEKLGFEPIGKLRLLRDRL